MGRDGRSAKVRVNGVKSAFEILDPALVQGSSLDIGRATGIAFKFFRHWIIISLNIDNLCDIFRVDKCAVAIELEDIEEEAKRVKDASGEVVESAHSSARGVRVGDISQ